MSKRIYLPLKKKPANLLLQSVKEKRKYCQKLNKKDIKIESKRSVRQDINGPCSFCGSIRNPLWKFSKSTAGIIYLCERCKANRSNEKKNKNLSRREIREKFSEDFFKNKIVLVGKIESNKRKH